MDEITTCAPTHIAHVEHARVRLEVFDAASLGIPRATHAALSASSVEHAASIIRGVLEGGRGPARDIVAINAAAGIVVGGGAPDFNEGLRLALDAIDTGAARATLDDLARESSIS
jgi:anthranilate phosphoribosyltransferase